MADLNFYQSADPVVITDETGNLAKVDAVGRLLVYTPPSQNNITIQLSYFSATSTPLIANQWQEIFSYTVPTNYDLSIIQFQIVSSQGGDDTKVAHKDMLATYNTGTNMFTDGISNTLPYFSAELYLYVTTLIGGVANDNITITYTNQDGITGRTALITLPRNSLVGTRLSIPLQAGDYGVTDITNITHTQTGQAGVFGIEGVTSVVYLTAGTANILQDAIFSINSSVVNQDDTISLQYNTTAGGAKIRRITLIATLVPRS